MRVALRGIRKRFGGLQALDGVDLELHPGEVHALLGENGAGKTTLMNILYGLYQPDQGYVEIDGATSVIRSPADAIRSGIGMIHQHFTLTPVMTVAENLILGETRPDGLWLNRKKIAAEIAGFSRKNGMEVDPNARVWQLPVGAQQRVEILKALRRGARTLILDEPTAVLTPGETEELFRALRGFQEAGASVVFISHKLNEVMAISDRITVLRHGRVVGTTETTATDKDVLTRMMVGQDIPHEISRSRHLPGPALFSARHLRVEDDRGQIAVRDISFETHAGEILGIAGVDGNGQRELAETLVGLRPTLSGEIRLGAQEITGLPVSRRRMAHVPQDRLRTGLIPGFSVEENLILGVDHLERYSRYGALDQRAIRAHANDLVRRFDIRLQDVRQPVSTLSGGNQQKVVFARELSRNSDVLICFNPTRGVDVRATDEIHRRIIELRDRGAGILLISTELDEIIRLSDRIAVMCAGRIMGILTPDAPRQRIGALMAGMV